MVLERETWTIIIYKQTNDKFLFYLDFDIITISISIFSCVRFMCAREKKRKEERK